MCKAKVVISGDRRRVGEVSHALCGAVSGLQLIPQDDNTDKTEQHDTKEVDNDNDQEQVRDSDNTLDNYSPSLQQACPFTFPDIPHMMTRHQLTLTILD